MQADDSSDNERKDGIDPVIDVKVDEYHETKTHASESFLIRWQELPRSLRRTTIALLILIDANIGLLYGVGLLNQLDYFAGDRIPNDMIWLIQFVESVSAAFIFVKILFDDVPASWQRSVGIACSPLFLLIMIGLTLESLLQGLHEDSRVTLDLASIATNTMIWSSTYLAIAVGLTLTYKVQRYGNFAQSELFMIGMYLSMVMIWSDYFLPLSDAPRDGVFAWSLLLWTLLAAFVLTGLAGIIIDRLVYRGFRERKATPQVMMIASLGVALILRAIVYLRFGASKNLFEPGADWRVPTLRWDLPTKKLRIVFGDRSLRPSEDANANGEFDVETYTQTHADLALIPEGSAMGDIIPGSGEDLDADGRFDISHQTYTYGGTCEQSQTYTQAHADAGEIPETSVYSSEFAPEVGDIIPSDSPLYGTGTPAETYTDAHDIADMIPGGSCVGDLIPVDSPAYGTGEPVLNRIVRQGWNPDNVDATGSVPTFEIYDMASNCVDKVTTGYAYHKGAVPVLVFCSVFLLLILLSKTRLGRRMRAVADNPDLAASSGINVERVQITSAFLSAGISGMGGAIFAMTVRFAPETAFTLLLPSFAVIVLGTIGSIPGAVVASLLVGFIKALSAPMLIAFGNSLDRSNYAALEGVMPYIFLVAILLILPEGIGHAYEKWKVDRLRKRAEIQPSKQIGGIIAISPLGALGAHNFQQRKNSRGESMLIATVGAYIISRISRFIGNNSFAEGACSDACQAPLDDKQIELNELLMTSEQLTQLGVDPSSNERFSELLSRIEELQMEISEYSLDNFQMETGRSEGEFLSGDSPFALSDAPYSLEDVPEPPNTEAYTEAHDIAGMIPEGSTVGDYIPIDSPAFGTGSPVETYTEAHDIAGMIPDRSAVGDIIPTDSPAYGTGDPLLLDHASRDLWRTDTLGEMNASWVDSISDSWTDLMNTELTLVDHLVNFGDAVWPAVPILIWLIAVYEGYFLLKGRDDDALRPVTDLIDGMSAPITNTRNTGSVAMTGMLGYANAPLDLFHEMLYKGAGEFRSGIDNGQRNLFLFLLIIILAGVLPAFFAKSVVMLGLLYGIGLCILSWRSRGNPFPELRRLTPYGRESPFGSWMMFFSMMLFLFLFVEWLPVAEQDGMRFIKVLQVSGILLNLSIFALMAFSLNLHTGMTGMINFGVIFFVGVGAITVGVLTAPKDLHGYDWPIFWAVVVGVLLSAALGWLLAYPTARLRMDYFAIVTISLGEIVRYLLAGEPLLRAGSWGSAVGISNYPRPLESWWKCGSSERFDESGDLLSFDECTDVVGIGSPSELLGRSSEEYLAVPMLNETGVVVEGDIIYNATFYSMELGQPAPYFTLLAILGVCSVLVVWWLLETILKSPWGRILRAIREDEEVAQHHGHDVLTHKAASLAFGAAIAALAGCLWAWKLSGFGPLFMSPAKSTFLVWAAFVVGGAANNKGMVVGAFIIVLMESVFNVLVAGQGSESLPLHDTAVKIDNLFEWLVTGRDLSFWPHTTPVETFLMLAAFGLLIRKWVLVEIGFYGALIFAFTLRMLGERSIEESFLGGAIQANMAYVKVFLIGCLILFSLKYNPKGLLPEVPVRPDRPPGGDAG